MNDFVRNKLDEKLEELRADYQHISGKPFSHFYCPILFTDEDVTLCKAHVINRGLPDSPSTFTVQRKDVDNFYGSRFEADFLDIQKYKDRSTAEIITDRQLSDKSASKIYLEGKPVEFFLAKSADQIPEHFTAVHFTSINSNVPFGLKMHPADVVAAQGKSWEVEIYRDVRIHTIVSVIKAAHLTLFEMVGYRYGLSLAGHYVGHEILGKFFLQNRGKSKPDVLRAAVPYFREFAHMVRPVISCPFETGDSVVDRTFLMCVGASGGIWGFIVLVKTGDLTWGVLLPVFEQAEQAATYLNFLKNGNECIQIATCWFKNDQWEMTKNTIPLNWAKTGILYPEE